MTAIDRRAQAVATIDATLLRPLKPRKRLGCDQWAERHLRLAGATRLAGPIDLDLTPYLREILRASSDPFVRIISLCFAVQMGKSTALMARLGWAVARSPVHAMWITDTINKARDLVDDMLMPMLRATPECAAQIVESRDEIQKQRLRFLDGMTLWLTGANSPGNLASRSAGLLLPDEINKWPIVTKGRGGKEGNALALARARTTAYGGESLVMQASTPTEEGVGISHEIDLSTDERYLCPCPLCGEHAELRFTIDSGADRFGLVFLDEQGQPYAGKRLALASDREIAQAAQHVQRPGVTKYRCPRCGGMIDERDKPTMVRRGLWTPAGCARDRHGNLIGSAPPSNHRGFTASQLISPFVRWGEIAAKFIELRGVPDPAFVNQMLAEPWREVGKQIGHEQIIALPERSRAASTGIPKYPRGTIPDWSSAITAVVAQGAEREQVPRPCALIGTIDVQIDRVEYIVRAWSGTPGEVSWLIDWGQVACHAEADPHAAGDAERTPGDWSAVEELLARRYPILGPDGVPIPQRFAQVRWWGIDAGDRTDEVYRFAIKHGEAQAVTPMMGRSQLEPVRWTQAGDAERHGVARPVDLLLFDADTYKDAFARRRSIAFPQLSACVWPEAVDQDYARQTSAEHRVARKTGTSTRRYHWQRKPGRTHNHLFDCEIMQLALHAGLGVGELMHHQLRAAHGPGL